MRYQEPSPSVDHYSHPQMNTYLYFIIRLTLSLSGAGQPRPKRPAGADKIPPLGGTRISTLSINHGRDQGEGGSNNKNLELRPPSERQPKWARRRPCVVRGHVITHFQT